MKILFTTGADNWDAVIDARFGRTPGFLLYDEESKSFNYFDNTENKEAAQGAGIQAVQKVLEIKPDVIVTGNGPGGKAQGLIKDSDIKIYTGAGDISVKEAYNLLKENKLSLF